jgi:hypothetical protein
MQLRQHTVGEMQKNLASFQTFRPTACIEAKYSPAKEVYIRMGKARLYAQTAQQGCCCY